VFRALISYGLWQSRYGGATDILGKVLDTSIGSFTIIGVMPPRFGWYGNDAFWLPLSPARTDLPWVNPVVRLRSGTTGAVAEQQLDALHKALASEKPATFPKQGYTTSLRNYLDVTVASGEMRTSLQLLLGAVGFLLLIACANVANLQLSRGTARAREMAVRMSVGAGRGRLVRQLLTESVLLAVVGGAAGILFALGATRAIVALMPEFYVPNESRVSLNAPVLLFSLAVSLLTGIVFGLAPALQTSKPDLTDSLKGARGTGSGTEGRRGRNVLVVAEVALSVVLLVSAGLTIRTFLALTNVDTGIRADRVLVVGVPLPPAKYTTLDGRNRFAEELLERVRGLPGVEGATFGLPFGGPQSPFSILGQPADESKRIGINLGGADHLRVFGIQLRRGRMFDAAEVRRGDRVAVLNESALKLWPAGVEPLGSRVRLGVLQQPPPRTLADTARPPEVTIVGVIADTRNAGIRADPAPTLVLPYSVIAQMQRNLAVRSAADPNLLLNPIRAEVRAMDAEQPLNRPITMREILGQEVLQPRFTMALFSTLAALGLLLAAAGIYSVLSFHVTLRTHELGLRMALGARRAQVLGLMLAMGGRLVLVGLVIGIAASLASTRLLRSQLFGVQPADPAAYAGVAGVLALVTFFACYLPARRAAGVDPMVALRQE
jgi:predicted permease